MRNSAMSSINAIVVALTAIAIFALGQVVSRRNTATISHPRRAGLLRSLPRGGSCRCMNSFGSPGELRDSFFLILLAGVTARDIGEWLAGSPGARKLCRCDGAHRRGGDRNQVFGRTDDALTVPRSSDDPLEGRISRPGGRKRSCVSLTHISHRAKLAAVPHRRALACRIKSRPRGRPQAQVRSSAMWWLKPATP